MNIVLKSQSESNEKDRVIIIDNTPFPNGGSAPDDEIILQYISSSQYKMSYNLRNVSILMGLCSMILFFVIGALVYLTFKIRKEINHKFLSSEDDQDEEEEDDD